jgi:hypothetical protein
MWMPDTATPGTPQRQSSLDTAALFAIAAAIALLHLLTNSRYGFHRDELQFLSDAQRLAWGYISYPPLTPFLERISLHLFGLSLVGLRLFSVIAQAVTIVITGLMARQMGGGRMAQVTAALVVALSCLPLFNGTEFQYTSFDYLWCVLIAYFTIRLLTTEEMRWWLAIGAVIGVGLMTKYALLFLVCGVLGAFLFTSARRFLLNRWFMGGVTLAFLICLPNLLWQIHHHFISQQFLHSIHLRDVKEGRADGFWLDQLKICINPFAAPLCIGGLWYGWRTRYRPIVWMYLIPLALFTFAKGRGYYMAAAYPMVLALGAVAGERWVASLAMGWRRAVTGIFFTGLVAWGFLMMAIVLPLAASGPLRDFALKNNGDLREEFGWDELVQTVASIRDALPAEERAHVGVLVDNYGEQGAIDLLGPKYGLPAALSLTNSAWLRGYPAPPPTVLIVVGFSQNQADARFSACRLAGHTGNRYGVKNEESEYHPDIFVCGSPVLPWPEFWKKYQRFG